MASVPTPTRSTTRRSTAKGRPARVTLVDVAREAGVSRTTVSDVLNRGDAAAGLYADETRERVARAVQSLGYAPLAKAQSLARGRSNLIGLVLLCDFSNPYFARFANAVELEVARRGMRLQLAVRDSSHDASPQQSTQRDAELIARMVADDVEGLFVGPVYEQLDLSTHVPLTGGRLPTVLFGGSVESGVEFDTVAVDRDGSAALAIDHLQGLGHERIGFLCAPPSRTEPTRDDHFAAIELLRQRGVFAGTQWIAWQPDTGSLDAYAEATMAFCDQWLASEPDDRPTAVLCLNDAAAMAALGVFHRRGIRVPDDLSVVGFDDLPEAPHLVPALTSVDSHVDRQVAAMVERLLARIDNPDTKPGHVAITPTLRPRASTAAPPR
ncbi:MAG: LacI family DNA-binding transcriptional regulator [Planctomycetota bacterium]